jgi:hypothetical protein
VSRYFDFDDNKAAKNAVKHGVTFSDAISTFDDELGLDVYDHAHSTREDRWFRVGLSASGVVLVTVYTEEEDGRNTVIRIITSRRAKPDEVERYLRFRGKA